MEDLLELRSKESGGIVLDLNDLDEVREEREEGVELSVREEVAILGGERGEDLDGSLWRDQVRERGEDGVVIEESSVSSRRGVS